MGRPKLTVQLLNQGSRLLLDHTNDGVVIIQDATIRLVNPGLARIIGYSEEELTSKPFLDFIHPDDKEMVADRHFGRLKGESVPNAYDFRLIDRWGNTRWAEARVLNVDWEGCPALLVFLTEVTERKRMEEALRTSEERFRSLVEITSDWVWEVDANAAYTYNSPKLKLILGYDPEQLIGMTPFDLMLPNEANRLAEALIAAADLHETLALTEITCISRDNTPVHLETSVIPKFDANGKLAGFCGIARDISERHEAKVRLQQSLSKLQRTMECTIQAISLMVETRDCFTAGHQRRVSQLASAIAREMRLPDENIEAIRIAGLLHDIGKIAVPIDILSMPRQLTELELAIVKTHCQVGHDILETVDFSWPLADIVYQHHERLDGSGYPLGLRGENIMFEAKIVAVADVVEAMTAHRPYRAAPGVEKALEEISYNCGKLYEGDAVYACLTLFREKGYHFEDI